jgi:DNA repair protein RadD
METLMDCSSQNIVCADTGDKYVLRDYQVEAVESARRYLTDPRQKKPALIVMPTGSGKSLIIASIAEQIDEPLIVFQPQRDS